MSQTSPTTARATGAGALTRRAAMALLGAGAAGFVAFGPRGERASRAGRVVLDYWEKWTGHEGRAMQEVVDAFNASQSSIHVRYFITSNIGQKALVAIAGGTPPDVIGLWNFNIPAYAASGAIVALDELAPQAGLRLEQYKQGIQRVMTLDAGVAGVQGRWWGVVNTAGTLALYYNKAVLRDAGLDDSRGPATIERLDEHHARITRASAKGAGSSSGIDRVGFLHREPGWWNWLWPYHFGGPIIDTSSAQGTALFDAPHTLRAYEWLAGYPRALPGGVQAEQTFRQGLGNYGTPQNGFLTGKVAMVVQGPWLANMISTYAPDLDYGVAPFPCAQSTTDPAAPVSLVDTDVLCIPRGCRHPQEAMAFIAFTQRPDMTEKLALAHCKVNPLAAPPSEVFVRSHPNRGLAVHDALADSARAFVVPQTRAWPPIKDEFDSAVDNVWQGKQTPQQALGVLQQRATGHLARVHEQRLRRAQPSGGPA
jgi:multiple sugar transport system substrate-binding protein